MGPAEDLPAWIDLSRADSWSVYWLPQLGTTCLEPAHRPAWTHEVIGTATGRHLPVAIAGTLGKGRVFYATAALAQQSLLFVDPFCGPNAEDVFRLWLAIARWAFQPTSMPAIAMLREHQARLARLEANQAVNGDFEQPPAHAMVPGWFAESRSEPPSPLALGHGIGLDDSVRSQGKRALRVDTAVVRRLTSLAVPLRPGQAATFSAALRADRSRQALQIQIVGTQDGHGSFELSDTWKSVHLTVRAGKPPDDSNAVPAWIVFDFPTPAGTVWIDDVRLRATK